MTENEEYLPKKITFKTMESDHLNYDSFADFMQSEEKKPYH